MLSSDRDGHRRYGVPKYREIYEEVQQWIREGRYRPGDKLPSETDLIDEFGASRPTVVRALNLLQERGWITREHGRGTYAAAPPATVPAAVKDLIAHLEHRMDTLAEQLRAAENRIEYLERGQRT